MEYQKQTEEWSRSAQGLCSQLVLALYHHSPSHPINTSPHIYTRRSQLSENNQAAKERETGVCVIDAQK